MRYERDTKKSKTVARKSTRDYDEACYLYTCFLADSLQRAKKCAIIMTFFVGRSKKTMEHDESGEQIMVCQGVYISKMKMMKMMTMVKIIVV